MVQQWVNGHDSGNDWLEVYRFHIMFGLCFRPKFQGISPQFIWPNIWYVYVPPLNRILKISHWVTRIVLMVCCLVRLAPRLDNSCLATTRQAAYWGSLQEIGHSELENGWKWPGDVNMVMSHSYLGLLEVIWWYKSDDLFGMGDPQVWYNSLGLWGSNARGALGLLRFNFDY